MITLTLTAAATLLLLASTASARSSIEAGQGGASFDLGNLADSAESIMNQITEQSSTTPPDIAGANISAFLGMIRQAEGTASVSEPYRVCYGYSHTIRDMAEHPAITGEWKGQRLPDEMCKNAGFGAGCVSTAAGAYQIIKPTWVKVRDSLGLSDFSAASQDSAAMELIRRRGALEDVKEGRIELAIGKCRNEWASLPGNYAKQGQRDSLTLVTWYQHNGGTLA